MPSTVNGIGTRYYGSKNEQVRPGVCQACGKPSQLKSYDTRLWFTILFIPIIPISRKHIIDFCPRCTRHRVVSLADWEKAKQKTILEATAEMQAKPMDPKAAVKLHAALIAFNQTAEAAKLAELMKQRFGQDAETLSYLGSSLQFHGKDAEAVPFFEQALRVNPELPEAKVAVALNLINQKRLDEAQKLLQFLEAPDNRQSPGALYALAVGYQNASRHPEAVRLFTLLSQRFPSLAQDKSFRKAFKISELATGVRESTLPPRKLNWKAIVTASIVAALIIFGGFGSNLYIRGHRTLHIVSGLGQPVTLEIPGQPKVTLRSGATTVSLPEGNYHVTISGPTNYSADIRLASTFFGRWADNPAYILNVANSALLISESATYSKRGDERGGGGFSFRFAEPFIVLKDVDYVFDDFPASVSLPKHSSSVTKSRIGLFEGSLDDAVYALGHRSRYPEALGLAEWGLRKNHTNEPLLRLYLYWAGLANRSDQAKRFLAEGVGWRPIAIEWHREYQDAFMHGAASNAQIAAQYQDWLKADPDNSALLYLVGRLSPRKSESAPLYEQAIARNPSNAFAHFALGYQMADSGDWEAARPHLAEAFRTEPKNSQFEIALLESRVALRDASVEKDLRAALSKTPTHRATLTTLAGLLAAQNRTNEWNDCIVAIRRKMSDTSAREFEAFIGEMQAYYLYAAGQFEELENLGFKKAGSKHPPSNYQALIELGRLAEAGELLKRQPTNATEPYDPLALSLAYRLAGDQGKAAEWLAESIRQLESGPPYMLATAELLKGINMFPRPK